MTAEINIESMRVELPRKLYIIGNGFDLYHGLKTRYSDFNLYVDERDEDLCLQLEEFFTFTKDKKYLWRDFENDLGSCNYKSIFDFYNNTDPSDDSFKRSDVFGLEDKISEVVGDFPQEIIQAMRGWIDAIDYPSSSTLNRRGIYLDLAVSATFLSFNFTSLLESAYEIPKNSILYIHGNCDDYSELIIGHGDSRPKYPDPPTFDKYGEPTRHLYSDSESAARGLFSLLRKPTKDIIKENSSFFLSLYSIDDIVVLGHSFAEVDLPYFRKINKIAPNAKWQVSYYSVGDKENIAKATKLIGIRDKIEFIKIGMLKRRTVK